MEKKNESGHLKQGIYILRSQTPVPRCLQVDDDGILYIGKGLFFTANHRIGKFINSLKATETRHDGGIRYNQLAFLKKYPLETLTVHVKLTGNPRDEEIKLLNEYATRFGELPPLNRNS